jgi:hypothetical protein
MTLGGESEMPRRLMLAMMLVILAAAPARAGMSHALFAYSNHTDTTSLTLQLAGGGSQTIQAFDRGWYTQAGFHDPDNLNYLVGFGGNDDEIRGGNQWFRNFFVFALPSVSEPIVGARLNLEVPSFHGYVSQSSAAVFTLHDIAFSLISLMDGTLDVMGYEDLGDGPEYGTRVYTAGDVGALTTVVLNPAALATLNANRGRLWGAGGTLGFPEGIQSLPEPCTVLPAGVGAVLGMGLARRRVRRVQNRARTSEAF